jgi:hypothetical protein
MTFRIDPIRRSDVSRKARSPERASEDETHAAEVVHLPVPVTRVEPVAPRTERRGGVAAFAAQLIGQDGAKRGLRAGHELIPAAKRLYNRVEWSGSKDRRAPKGGKAKTEI